MVDLIPRVHRAPVVTYLVRLRPAAPQEIPLMPLCLGLPCQLVPLVGPAGVRSPGVPCVVAPPGALLHPDDSLHPRLDYPTVPHQLSARISLPEDNRGLGADPLGAWIEDLMTPTVILRHALDRRTAWLFRLSRSLTLLAVFVLMCITFAPKDLHASHVG